MYIKDVAEAMLANEAYYGSGEPLMSDDRFDALVDRIQLYERENPDDISPQSPTQVVGSVPLRGENVTRHAYPMLSLSKITDLDKARQRAREITGDLLVQLKLDGVSMSLEYRDGSLLRALTRGDGASGEDVTAAMRLLPSIPTELAAEFTGFVRGEVVIHVDELPAGLKNARNGAAGSINHSDPAVAARRKCRFYAFDVLGDGLTDTGSALEAVKEMGFTLAPTVRATANDVHRTITAMLGVRAQIPYEADGVVVKAALYSTRDRMGQRTNSPRWAFAFKTASETAQARVTGLKHQVGKSGSIGLVYTIEPTDLAGTTISNITAHNFSEIRRLDVRKGDVVTIRRAGDVIPFCECVTDPTQRDGTEEVFEMPTQCPGCSAPLETYGTKNQLRCTGDDCTPQLVRRLVHWASRKAADIDGLSTDLIEKLVEREYLESVVDFYYLELDHFVEIGRSHDFAVKMLTEIEKSKNLGMRRALIGLSIPQASEGSAARLCKEFGRVEAVANASVGELASVPDVGLVVASSIHDFFKSSTVDVDLRAAGVNLERLPEDAPLEFTGAEGGFSGLTVVVTGALSVSRDDFKALLTQHGAKVVGSVSGKTDVLVAGQNVGAAKTSKAKQLGVKVVDEQTARAMMNE